MMEPLSTAKIWREKEGGAVEQNPLQYGNTRDLRSNIFRELSHVFFFQQHFSSVLIFSSCIKFPELQIEAGECLNQIYRYYFLVIR